MHPSCFIIIISNFSQTLEKVLQIPYKKGPEGRLETFGWERKKLFEKEKVFFFHSIILKNEKARLGFAIL